MPYLLAGYGVLDVRTTLDAKLLKEDVDNILVWVKLHNVHIMAFREDGLSVIATKLGTPLMLDSCTYAMCMESWGFSMCTIHVEYEWKPPRCSTCKVFGHVLDDYPKRIISDFLMNVKNHRQVVRGVQNGPNTSGNKKQDGLNSQESSKAFDRPTTTFIAERINDLERQMLDGKLVLVDDDEKPLKKIDSLVDSDSDSNSEVEENKSLLEQWKKTIVDDDYDPYDDDDVYDGHDISENLQAICDHCDIKVCG
ncbi:hypothetical protein Tco_0051763 [Tanacetum coccineum]